MDQKMWGPAIWIFFHSLANDITDQQFQNYKNKIITLFLDVCNLLPCIVCRNHAQEAISKAYIKYINTKNDFVLFLIQFHNLVNIRKKIMPLTELEVKEIYKNIDFYKTVYNFLNVFTKQYYTKDFSYGLKKENFLNHNKNFINELKNNIHKNN